MPVIILNPYLICISYYCTYMEPENCNTIPNTPDVGKRLLYVTRCVHVLGRGVRDLPLSSQS